MSLNNYNLITISKGVLYKNYYKKGMREMKKILAIILATMLTIGGLGTVTASASTEIGKNKEDIFEYQISNEELQQFFIENDIPIEKQEILNKKVENQEAWDCYKANAEALIPDEFSYFDINDEVTNRRYVFEDGSFIEVNINPTEQSDIKENINSRTTISDSFGTFYSNHKVQRTVGLTSAYFYANFYVARYGPSSIYTESDGYNSPYGEGVSGFGVTANPQKEMIRKTESTSTKQAALFRLKWFNQVNVSGSWAGVGGSAPIGSTCNLYLALVNNRMYVDSTLPF